MSMGQAVRSVFSKYVVFEGRSRRSEYWMFVLFNFLVYAGLSILAAVILGFGDDGAEAAVTTISGLYGMYSLAVFLPSLAVCVRRLHDTGKSGWFILIGLIPFGGIVLLVWFATDSQPGSNAYGQNPKEKPGFSGEIPAGGVVYVPDPSVPGTIPTSKPLDYDQVMRPRVSAPEIRVKSWLGQGSLILGRNGDCGLVFPGKTPGVSGRHCAVSWDSAASEFIVRDLNSTYGTYLKNGTRLDPSRNYRLKPGTNLYLGGERNNEVRLEIA